MENPNHPNRGWGGKHLAAGRKRFWKSLRPLGAFFQMRDNGLRARTSVRLHAAVWRVQSSTPGSLIEIRKIAQLKVCGKTQSKHNGNGQQIPVKWQIKWLHCWKSLLSINLLLLQGQKFHRLLRPIFSRWGHRLWKNTTSSGLSESFIMSLWLFRLIEGCKHILPNPKKKKKKKKSPKSADTRLPRSSNDLQKV